MTTIIKKTDARLLGREAVSNATFEKLASEPIPTPSGTRTYNLCVLHHRFKTDYPWEPVTGSTMAEAIAKAEEQMSDRLAAKSARNKRTAYYELYLVTGIPSQQIGLMVAVHPDGSTQWA